MSLFYSIETKEEGESRKKDFVLALSGEEAGADGDMGDGDVAHADTLPANRRVASNYFP